MFLGGSEYYETGDSTKRNPSTNVTQVVHSINKINLENNQHFQMQNQSYPSHVNTISETQQTAHRSVQRKVKEFGPFHCLEPFGQHACLIKDLDRNMHILKGAISPFTALPQICAFAGSMGDNEFGFEFYTKTRTDSTCAGHLGIWSGAEPRDGLILKNNKAILEQIRVTKEQYSSKQRN